MDLKETKSGVPVIVLEGEVDVYTAPQLKLQMINLLEKGSKQVIINLEKVEYLDSTALGVMIGGLKRMREIGGNISLLCPNPRIRRIFEITGLDRIFDIRAAEEQEESSSRKEPK
jgi:anti-sigma B factor antagonist